MNHQKRSLLCLLFRKQPSEDGRGPAQCGCRAARLFDFTTDSWRSRVVVVLVFLSVYVQSANVVLAYSGISLFALDSLINNQNCMFVPSSNNDGSPLQLSRSAQVSNVTPPVEPPSEFDPIEPADALVEWASAFSVVLQMVAFLVGLSSRQHIAITILSFFGYAIFSIFTIAGRFKLALLSIPDIYSVLSHPGGARCLPVLFPTLMQYFFEFILTGTALIAFSTYMISCLIKQHEDGNFDDWRLKEVAYPLVRRLASPIPAESLPKQKSCFNRILKLRCLRSPPPFDQNDTDIQEEEGLLSRRRKGWRCPRSPVAAVLGGIRQALFFLIHLFKNAFASPAPSTHSLFERPSDIIYSSRIIIALSACISIMLLIATTVFGIISSTQDSLQSTLDIIRANNISVTNTEVYQFAQDIINELPYISALACSVGFITVVVISLITLQTYKRWIFELRQGRRPFNPVLVGNGTFWASSYMGHQLSHFLLGFVVCILVVFVGYLAVRVIISISIVRAVLKRYVVRVSVPFVINFMIQFVLARIFSATGGKDLRFKFLFQIIDLLNTILSALTTILPSFFRLMFHYSLNLLIAGRLDKPSLFPALDSAHHTFAAVVFQDHFNNNPIKLVFVDQMLQIVKSDNLVDPVLEKSRRMMRRWRLAILLARHPHLQKMRKHALIKQRAAEMESEEEELSLEIASVDQV